MKLTVYVFTSDKYLEALRPFAYLFNKYWGEDQQVIVCGFKSPKFDLPDNFTFFSIGNQDDYPIDKWTDAVIDTLNHFPRNRVFCLMLEDYWITRNVDLQSIEYLTDYMYQFQYVLKMDMRTDRRFSGYALTDFDNNAAGNVQLVKSDPASPYHMSLMCGLWNRDRLLEILVPGETPWEVETNGKTYKNLVNRGSDLLVLGTTVSGSEDPNWCPIPHTLAHRRGDPNKYAFDEDVDFGISKDDVETLTSMGFLDESKL